MKIINDRCSCGEPISVEIDCKRASRADGKRPFYPDDTLPEGLDPNKYSVDSINVFRCRKCNKPVNETVPSAAHGDINTENSLEHNGENFIEMLEFTGKWKKFDECFSNEYQYVKHCIASGKVFRVFYSDGTKEDVRHGDVLVRCGTGEIRVLRHMAGVVNHG